MLTGERFSGVNSARMRRRCVALAWLAVPALAHAQQDQAPPQWISFASHGSTGYSPSVVEHSAAASGREPFLEARLGTDSDLLLQNSVMCVPQLLSPAECQHLVQAAEQHISSNPLIEPTEQFVNVRLCDMDAAALNLSNTLLRQRVLRFLQSELPESSLKTLFGHSKQLDQMELEFSRDEPAVNRYIKGGDFSVHCDGKAITVIVPLDEKGHEFDCV